MNIVCFSLSSYNKRVRGVDQVTEGLMGELTQSEKYMLDTHEVIEIRGKVNIFCFFKQALD